MNIDQKQSISLIASYWSKRKPISMDTKNVFVGDVHGDLNQFILPLVETGILTIVDHIKLYSDGRIPVYIPEYIAHKSDIQIYYLGDYIDGGIYSRSILAMMVELSSMPNLHFCIGNHEANILGKLLNGNVDYRKLKSYWPTMQVETTAYDDIHVCKASADEEFLDEYFKPLFDCLRKLYDDRKLEICYEVDLDEKYIVSHALITKRSIDELMSGTTRTLAGGSEKLTASEINDRFRSSKPAYIAANRLVYNRTEKDIYFDRNIVGHTPGGDFRALNINPVPCLLLSERREHCKPTFKDKHIIMYFDIKASAGYDMDNVSRPDYFYYVNKKEGQTHGIFSMSNANALRLYYAVDIDSIIFEEYAGKNKTDGVTRLYPEVL